MKRPTLQNMGVGVLRMVFRARKVFGTFEKRAPARHLKKMHVCTVFEDGVEYMSLSSGSNCPISPSTLV